MKYSKELKESMIRRMLPPNNDSAYALAQETGISEGTLRIWKRQALEGGYSPDGQAIPEKWSTQDKFMVVVETVGLSETELSEYRSLSRLLTKNCSVVFVVTCATMTLDTSDTQIYQAAASSLLGFSEA